MRRPIAPRQSPFIVSEGIDGAGKIFHVDGVRAELVQKRTSGLYLAISEPTDKVRKIPERA